MNKPSEEHIEHYIHYPSDLSARAKKWIEKWIDKDQELRLLADWYRKYFKQVEQIEKSSLLSVNKPDYIQLRPLKETNHFSSGLFALTAQTTTKLRKRSSIQTVRTFVSVEHKTVIRVLHDSSKNQTKLHVISEFVDSDDIVLIKVPEESTLIVSEPGGTFPIPDQITSENNIREWDQCDLYLNLIKVHIYRDKRTNFIHLDTSGTDRSKTDINIDTVHDKVQLTIDLKDRLPSQKLVSHSDGESNLWTLEGGACSIPIHFFSTSGSTLFFFK